MRQAHGVAWQRLLLLLASFSFAVLIPRAMGPEMYGRFALAHTMTLWFTALGGMGAVSMMTRFVPEFRARGDEQGLRRLVSSLFALRLLNGLGGMAAYGVLAAFWLHDLDPAALALAAASIAIRTVANLPFTVLLGLNQAARWEMGDLTRRVCWLAFVWAGFHFAGLRGACGALLLTEVLVLTLGLWWSHGYLEPRLMRVDRAYLAPFLRFSSGFFISNLLIMLFHQGGSALVKTFAGGYVESGYYHLAFLLYIAVTQTTWSLLCAFGPLFSALHGRQEAAEIKAWTERLLATIGAVTMLGCALTWTHGAMIVRAMVGSAYEPAGLLLPWFGLAAVCFVPGGLARLLAVTYGQQESSIVSAGLQLAVFVAACWALVPVSGGRGACYGLVLGVIVFAAYGTWRMRRSLDYSLRRWLQMALMAALCSPAVWWWNAGANWRLALFAILFTATLAGLRLLRREDLTALLHRG